jgi:hypothetical protein
MRILPDVALTYDDVLLVPQYSDVESRKKLSTQTKLTLANHVADSDRVSEYGHGNGKCDGDCDGARGWHRYYSSVHVH